MDDREKMFASAGARLGLIAESYERLTGSALASSPDDLWDAPRAIVAHGTEHPPLFFYGNRQALTLFRMPIERFIGMPSYRSAEPALREERAAMLARLAERDMVDDYSGVRIAADGSRFRIERATVWNLRDEAGRCHGQAATFADWTPL